MLNNIDSKRLMDVLTKPNEALGEKKWTLPRGIRVSKYRKTRTVLEYMYEVLSYLEKHGVVSRFNLMRMLENNNGVQFGKAVNPLFDNGYIELANPMVRTKFYIITEKGKAFLGHIRDLKPYLLELDKECSIVKDSEEEID